MCFNKWFKQEIVWWRLLLAAVLYTVVAQVIHTVGAFVTMSYYLMPQYFSVWSKLMMPQAGPPPASFYCYAWLFSLIGGLLFVCVYSVIKNGVPGKQDWQKGMIYGFLVFLVGVVPGYLGSALLVNLPFGLLYFWTVESLIALLISGAAVGKLMK